MHFYQTKSIHPTRSWTLDFAVLARLPVLLILWSACWLLTGCDVPGSSLTPGPKPENELTNQAYSLTVEELSEAFSEETFREFFTERQAEAIWNRLRLCLAGTISGGIAETIIDQDTTMNAMLLQHLPEKQAELRKAITLYIGYQKQLYLLSAPRITQEIAFDNLLLSNGLVEMWNRLQSAKNDSKDTVDLRGMLQGLPPIVQIRVLEELIPWINKHLQVFELDLSGNWLTMLPESMGGLSNLRQLNLSYNNLTLLPDSIGKLSNLRGLDVSVNYLTELPAFIGNLSNLRDLNVSRNNLTELPACIGKLSNLRWLDVSSNKLKLLPACIGNLSKLRQLDVSGNRLTELPACIGNLSKLRQLNVSGNILTVLPESLRKLSMLKEFSITQEIAFDNLLLSNGLVEMWNRLQSAKNDSKDTVDLSGILQGLPPIVQIRVLEEVIPWINKHLHVFELNLSGNSLTMLPECMGDLSNLLQLNLSDNSLTELPACIGKLPNLRELNVSRNNLTVLPNFIGNLSNLCCLDLAENRLTELPAFIGNLPKLRDLNVSRNNLTELPACIEKLSNLRWLDVSSNKLNLLPACIGNLSKLRKLDVSGNRLNELPACIGNLSKLRQLNVSGNILTVLPGLQKLTNLSDFDASHNSLLKPAACQGMGVLLTANNVHEFCFPSLKELAALCIVQEKLYYNTPAHTNLPPDCISRIENPKTYPVILLTTQLGRITLLKSVPIITRLSYKQIRDYLSSKSQVILIQQT